MGLRLISEAPFWILRGSFSELGRSFVDDLACQEQVFEISAPLWPLMGAPREKITGKVRGLGVHRDVNGYRFSVFFVQA